MGAIATFSLAKYGELACQMLAEEWCRRRQFWFNMWREQGDSDYMYTKEDIDSYQEDLEFVNFLCETPTDSPAWERAEALRKQVPPL